jgi:uncharacterized membrane protein
MAAPPDPHPVRRRPAWLGFGIVLLLLAIPLRLLPDGREHGAFTQFLGRFHPALVHIPIALLVLVPLLELAGCFRRWTHLRAAAGFVLGIAAAGALVSALDGWLLAYSGGYSGPLVTRHLWGGVALAGLCLVAAALRSRVVKHEGGFIFFYLPLLFIAVGLMVWTSDQGGKITHGENFLTEYMPRRLRSWLHLPPPPVKAPPITVEEAVGAGSLFGARVVPIINRSCISCHNPKKIKGGLLLDSYAHLMKGGEDGAVVVPWYPSKSDLVRRVTLPQDDDDFMPNNGKNLLSPDDVKLLERWIAAGASPTEPLDAEPPQ